MLKKIISYTNLFTDEQVTEEYYFHISKADLVEMEMEEHNLTYRSKDGQELTGMQAKLQRIIDSEDGKAILIELKDIIRRSYGKKDGDRFIKSQALWENFASSEAFSQLLFDLCTDATASAEFINGVIPSDIEKVAAEVKARAEQAQGDPTGLTEPTPAALSTQVADGSATGRQAEILAATPESPVTLTRVEMTEMADHEFKSGLADGRYKLS